MGYKINLVFPSTTGGNIIQCKVAYLLEITSGDITTSPLTTSPLTTSPLTTSPLTTGGNV